MLLPQRSLHLLFVFDTGGCKGDKRQSPLSPLQCLCLCYTPTTNQSNQRTLKVKLSSVSVWGSSKLRESPLSSPAAAAATAAAAAAVAKGLTAAVSAAAGPKAESYPLRTPQRALTASCCCCIKRYYGACRYSSSSRSRAAAAAAATFWCSSTAGLRE